MLSTLRSIGNGAAGNPARGRTFGIYVYLSYLSRIGATCLRFVFTQLSVLVRWCAHRRSNKALAALAALAAFAASAALAALAAVEKRTLLAVHGSIYYSSSW